MKHSSESSLRIAEDLIRRGRPEQALEHLAAAIGSQPEDPRLLKIRGRALNNLERLGEAADMFRRAITLEPGDTDALAGLAHVLAAQGDAPAAEKYWRRALENEPDHLKSLRGLGRLLATSRRLEEALPYLIRITELDASDPGAWLNLAEVFQFLDRLADAESALRRAVALSPGQPEFQEALGRLLFSQGQIEDAAQSYGVVLDENPQNQTAAAGRALCLEVMGRREEGLDLLEPFLASPVRKPMVDYAAGRLLLGANRYQEALNHLSRAVRSDDPRCSRSPMPWYTLGMVLDKLGRYDEAFDAWSRANRLKPSVFDLQDFEQRVREIIGWFHAERVAAWRDSEPRHQRPLPLFIVGMPRSGTTLVEQILACHAEVEACGERLVLEAAAKQLWTDSRQVGLGDESLAARIRKNWRDAAGQQRPGLKFQTDKFPGNFMHLGLARQIWPEMRVVWCRRDAADAAVSIFSGDFNRNILPWTNRLEHIAAMWKAHEDLMTHWTRVLRVPIVQVQYEALVTHPEEQIRKLLEAIELDWEPACLEFHSSGRLANTASYDQVRRPIYTSSVGRSKPYSDRLTAFFRQTGS